MWLRWVVSNLANQVAEDKVRRVVESAKQVAGRSTARTQAASRPGEAADVRADVVVLFGSELEAGGLVDQLSDPVMTQSPSFREYAGTLAGRPLVVACCGVGRQAALGAADDIVNIHRPRWMISAGFAGALTPQLRRGQMLLVREVANDRGAVVPIGLPLADDQHQTASNVHQGRLLTVDEPLHDQEQKCRLAEQHQAVACDMETISVARVCQQHQVPLIGVRIITDQLDERLPAEVERLLHHQTMAGKLGVVTRALFRRPGSMKDMWRLRETAVKASDRLARFLTGVIAQLPAPTKH